jgi:hypothetical protein
MGKTASDEVTAVVARSARTRPPQEVDEAVATSTLGALVCVITPQHPRPGRTAAGAGAGAYLRQCLAGARWAAQNILDHHPDADLRVYVVWVQRRATDARTEISAPAWWTRK